MGFVVNRVPNGWHVQNTDTLEHWVDPTEDAVLASIDLYKQNKADQEKAQKEAEEAAKNPSVAEFGTHEPQLFEHTPASEGGSAPSSASAETESSPSGVSVSVEEASD